MADTEKAKPKARTRTEIEADLAAARARLSTGVEDLIDQVHPTRVKQRQVDGFKQLANAELENAKSQVIDPDGGLRTDRIAVVAGAVAGLVAFIVIVRKIIGRKDR